MDILDDIGVSKLPAKVFSKVNCSFKCQKIKVNLISHDPFKLLYNTKFNTSTTNPGDKVLNNGLRF